MAATMGLFFFGILSIFYALSPNTEAKVVQGTIVPTAESDGSLRNWQFLTRFCFKSEKSRVEFEFMYPKRYYLQTLLLYYDSPSQWGAVYPPQGQVIDIPGHSMINETCTERLQPLRGANQMLTLKVNSDLGPHNDFIDKYPWTRNWYDWDRCDTDSNGTRVTCKFDVSFRSKRDRWWYIAISNCEGNEGLYLNYKINLTNAPAGDIFFHHFSADEFYILQIDLIFLVVQIIVLIGTIVEAYFLIKLDFYHVTFKIFVASMCIELIHIVASCWENGVYAHTGIENKFGEYLALLFQAIAYILFIIMLILLGKGYTITRGRLRTVAVIKLTVFIVAYIVLYLAMFLWEMLIFDEGLVIYRYASVPGYGLVVMRVVAWIWFLYGIIFTLKHYPEKKRFFIPFAVFYSIWFLAGPIFVLISVFAIPSWVRATTVNGVENSVTVCGAVMFLILTRPSKANSTFPFRVRTWQIAVLEGEEVVPDETPAYGVAAKYTQDISSVDMFTATQFRDQSASNGRTVGMHIDKFPHHEENDTSHFEIAVSPAR